MLGNKLRLEVDQIAAAMAISAMDAVSVISQQAPHTSPVMPPILELDTLFRTNTVIIIANAGAAATKMEHDVVSMRIVLNAALVTSEIARWANVQASVIARALPSGLAYELTKQSSTMAVRAHEAGTISASGEMPVRRSSAALNALSRRQQDMAMTAKLPL